MSQQKESHSSSTQSRWFLSGTLPHSSQRSATHGHRHLGQGGEAGRGDRLSPASSSLLLKTWAEGPNTQMSCIFT